MNSKFQTAHTWALVTIVGTVLMLLAYRMTLGVDLSDEGYYVSFIDGWLKTGIRDSAALGLHQTAALIVYPLARAYAILNGSTAGLVLFLRFVYLLMSCIAGICFYQLVRQIRGRTIATFASLTVVAFIPFSLPSPSYNTVGMLAMICALLLSGVLFLRISAKHAHPWIQLLWPWAVGSACAWMLAVVAYPTLILVQAVFLAVVLTASQKSAAFEPIKKYAFLCVLAQAAGLAILLYIYGSQRFLAMVSFSNASLQVTTGVFEKVLRFGGTFVLHPWFGVASTVSFLLGFAIRKDHHSLTIDAVIAVAVISVLLLSLLIGPVLYAQAHDYVFLLAILGAPLCIPARSTSQAEKPSARSLPVFPMLLFTGVFAGAVTSLTATNGMVNFAVGGSFAMALSAVLVVGDRKTAEGIALHTTLLACIGALLLWSALNFIYGEGPNPATKESRRVSEGLYAGLLTTNQNASSLHQTSLFFSGTTPAQGTVAVLGRLPGVYLLTSLSPLALSTWDFGQQNGAIPAIERLNDAFYTAHQPDVLAVVSDPWTKPLSPAGQKLLADYVRKERRDFGAWSVQLYRPRVLN
jgi:hypothetical protein